MGRFALKTLPQKRESQPQIRTNASANLDAYRGYFWRLGQIGSQPGLTGKKRRKKTTFWLAGAPSWEPPRPIKIAAVPVKAPRAPVDLTGGAFFLDCCTDRNKCKVRRECGWGEGRGGERRREGCLVRRDGPAVAVTDFREEAHARSGAVRRCSRWAD